MRWLSRGYAPASTSFPAWSYYWWEGEVSRGEEVVMIIKTRATLAERVSTVVKQMHSYSVPAVIVLAAGNRGQGLPRLADGGDGSGTAIVAIRQWASSANGQGGVLGL